MGLCDWVKCEYPLTDPPVICATQFQTQDTPSQHLEHYRIDAAGQLWHETRSPAEQWIISDFTGSLKLTATTIRGGCPRGTEYVWLTQHDGPAYTWAYMLYFIEGLVSLTTGGRTILTDRTLITQKDFEALCVAGDHSPYYQLDLPLTW